MDEMTAAATDAPAQGGNMAWTRKPVFEAMLDNWNVGEDGDTPSAPHKLTVMPGGYGLDIDITAADGRVFSVFIEIDKGMPVVRTYVPGQDEPTNTMRLEGSEIPDDEEA